MLRGFDTLWLIAVIGGLSCAATLLFGLRLLTSRAKQPAKNNLPLDSDVLHGINQDRRTTPRRKGNMVSVELSYDGKTVFIGQVLDRSHGGLRLLVDEPIEVGAILKIRPARTGSSVAWVEVSVRTHEYDGVQHEIGCKFQRTPTWNVMVHFG